LTTVSLLLAAAALVILGGIGFALYWASLLPVVRAALARRLAYAAWIGLAATVCYDVTRIVVDRVLQSPINPFEALPLYGQLLTGAPADSGLARAVGVLYHGANGVGFGMAFVMIVGRPGPLSGLAWGLGLELAMALLYPSWLRIQALEEFLTISVVGHAAYGLSLGILARSFLGRTTAGVP
jgi:hypothetical protein